MLSRVECNACGTGVLPLCSLCVLERLLHLLTHSQLANAIAVALVSEQTGLAANSAVQVRTNCPLELHSHSNLQTCPQTHWGFLYQQCHQKQSQEAKQQAL